MRIAINSTMIAITLAAIVVFALQVRQWRKDRDARDMARIERLEREFRDLWQQQEAYLKATEAYERRCAELKSRHEVVK